jgi:hypothetical protein
VFRFVPNFPTRAGARRYAVAEGLRWLSGRVASRPPESDPNQEPAWPRKN